MKPLHWDEVRRAQLCAELNAYYARLYGLTCDELPYMPYSVDTKEVLVKKLLLCACER